MICSQSNGFCREKLLTNWFIQSLTAVIKMHFDPEHNVKLACISHFTIGAIILWEGVNGLYRAATQSARYLLEILINHF